MIAEGYKRNVMNKSAFSSVFYSGAEKLSEGQSAEALSSLQTASSLPAPRSLVAYTHLLSGACLVSMVTMHTQLTHATKEKI